MRGMSVETLPVVGGHAPTLLGNDGTGPGNYGNDHPVGPEAKFACGGGHNWDCAVSSKGGSLHDRPIQQPVRAEIRLYCRAGRSSSGVPTVTCTTCHDEHSQTAWSGKIGGVQATWRTSFFVRGLTLPIGRAMGMWRRNSAG